MSNLGVFGVALKPAADAIRAQRAAVPGAGVAASGGGGSGFGGGGIGGNVSVNFNGPINASDPAEVQAMAATIVDTLVAAAATSEPGPPGTLAGVLP